MSGRDVGGGAPGGGETGQTDPADLTEPAGPADLTGPAVARAELADAQARLVAALVAGAPLPAGFDAELAGQAAKALLRKRAGGVARAWPRLAAAYAPQWPGLFVRWAEGRPPLGGWRDGFDFARAHRDSLPALAAVELAINEVRWAYDGRRVPRRRRLPALRRCPGGVVFGLFGRVALRRLPGGKTT